MSPQDNSEPLINFPKRETKIKRFAYKMRGRKCAQKAHASAHEQCVHTANNFNSDIRRYDTVDNLHVHCYLRRIVQM